MSKLTIMQWIPWSGKSTKAKEIQEKEWGIRINKDSLRDMLHFGVYTPDNENVIRETEKLIARHFCQKFNIIVDDTNLTERCYNWWLNFAEDNNMEVETIVMNTPIDECIRRDKLREKGVWEDVIRDMAERMEMLLQKTWDSKRTMILFVNIE